MLHGHLGPFLALGVRAGLRAIEILGRSPMEMLATVFLVRRVPYTCFLDGVQITTGCTLGKGNLRVLDGEGIRAHFTLGGRGLGLEVKEEVLREAEAARGRQEELAWDFMARKLEDLFREKLI